MFYPSADIRVNYGPPVTGQTGPLFLPFDVRIGRKLNENTVLSLEVGVPIVKEYPSITSRRRSDSTRCSEIPSPFLKAYSKTRQQRINSGSSLPIQYLPC